MTEIFLGTTWIFVLDEIFGIIEGDDFPRKRMRTPVPFPQKRTTGASLQIQAETLEGIARCHRLEGELGIPHGKLQNRGIPLITETNVQKRISYLVEAKDHSCLVEALREQSDILDGIEEESQLKELILVLKSQHRIRKAMLEIEAY